MSVAGFLFERAPPTTNDDNTLGSAHPTHHSREVWHGLIRIRIWRLGKGAGPSTRRTGLRLVSFGGGADGDEGCGHYDGGGGGGGGGGRGPGDYSPRACGQVDVFKNGGFGCGPCTIAMLDGGEIGGAWSSG